MTAIPHHSPRVSRMETQRTPNKLPRKMVRSVLISRILDCANAAVEVALNSSMLYSFPTGTLSRVNGHSAKHHTPKSNSEQEETPGDSSGEAEEEEQQPPLSQKPSRSTAAAPVRKSRSTSEEEEETKDIRPLSTRHKPPVSSDKEDKRPHQNGRNVEEAVHKDPKKKSKVSPSKSQDKQKSASTHKLDGAESDELCDSPKRSSPRKKRLKKGDEQDAESKRSSDESDFETRTKRLTRNRSICKRPRGDSSASQSSEQEYKPKRKSRRKRSTGSSDQESDNSENAPKRRLSLRALPKKKYISDNSFSEEDSASAKPGRQRTGNRTVRESREDGYNTRVSNRTSQSETRNCVSSKRKCIYTSDSDDGDEDREKEPVSKSNKNSKSGPSKCAKKDAKRGNGNEQDTSSHSDSSEEEEEKEEEDEEHLGRSTRGKESARQPKRKRKESYSSSKHSSDSESEQSSSASENSFASSGSHSSPKRSRTRSGIGERTASRQLRQRRQRSASEEEDSDESYSKPRRKTRVNTRNRGKRTVKYNDSE